MELRKLCGSPGGEAHRNQKPKGGGSLYFSYKKFHSIVLMALSDAKYRFPFIDVGAEGGVGDGGTWQKCNLARAITYNRAGLPQDRNLPNDDEPIPFIVVDDAFALKSWMMKPYSHQSQDPTERLYSYRLSRARFVVENAFSLVQMRWRVFRTTMQPDVKVCKNITLCTYVMHNLALQHYPCAGNNVDQEDQHHNVVQYLEAGDTEPHGKTHGKKGTKLHTLIEGRQRLPGPVLLIGCRRSGMARAIGVSSRTTSY
ncbi:uncharacterized protein LOC135195397 [Macrobrachium nipponense]|uniref:uncharacterized protein LOC135195397 n=1 Tax=Macrobrachium nipponense TaxID=159736 RepID=UPI0030C7B246